MVSFFSLQALTLLETDKPDFNQAKYLIDLLDVLAEKTKGNLTSQETEMLEGIRYELKMKFVEKSR